MEIITVLSTSRGYCEENKITRQIRMKEVCQRESDRQVKP